MTGDPAIPSFDGTMNWYWAEEAGEESTIDELSWQIRFRYGRGFSVEFSDDGEMLEVYNSVPEDVTEEVGEPTIRFNSVHVCSVPVFAGYGYVVTRLPPRPTVAQWFREKSDYSPNPP